VTAAVSRTRATCDAHATCSRCARYVPALCAHALHDAHATCSRYLRASQRRQTAVLRRVSYVRALARPLGRDAPCARYARYVQVITSNFNHSRESCLTSDRVSNRKLSARALDHRANSGAAWGSAVSHECRTNRAPSTHAACGVALRGATQAIAAQVSAQCRSVWTDQQAGWQGNAGTRRAAPNAEGCQGLVAAERLSRHARRSARRPRSAQWSRQASDDEPRRRCRAIITAARRESTPLPTRNHRGS
jgi:hypothetical protein